MATVSLKSRIFARQASSVIQLFLYSAVILFAFWRLSHMQLTGLAPVGGALLALQFGFTSLLFGRARCYPAGPIQRRGLVAAELTLRSTLATLLSEIVAAITFMVLSESDFHTTKLEDMPIQILPVIFATFSLAIMAYGFMSLSAAVRIIVPELLFIRKPRTILRRFHGQSK